MANTFNEDIEGAKELTRLIEVLKTSLKEVAAGIKKANSELKFDNVKNIEKIDEEIKNITEAEKDLIEVQKQEIKIQKDTLKQNFS